MDAQSLRAGMRLQDTDYPARVERICFLTRVRDGKQYDHLTYAFADERDGTGQYVKLADRRPAVRTGLCRVVVNDSVALLFGEARFPMVHTADETVRATIKTLINETRLVEVMNDAAVKGSVGSIVVMMRVLRGRVFFEVMETAYLTPTYDPAAPDTLLKIVERRKVDSAALKAAGYTVDAGTYWFQRVWDGYAETWYQPQSLLDAAEGKPPVVDAGRTVAHGLGFVPAVWIRNLPGGDGVDGCCTFEAAIDTVMAMDYQLSQAGRGLKYAADPTLLIKEPALGEGGALVRSAAEAIVVSKDGDAKLLEISGTAAAAVVDYVRVLREVSLEAIHGNRTNVDKLNGAQSGRALEMMNQGLIWLADRLRISYGQYGLLALIGLVCQASAVVELTIAGRAVGKLAAPDMKLVWPRFFPPTYDEKFAEANAYTTLQAGHLISRETAVAKMAPDNDVEDVAAELALIDADIAAEDAREKAQAATVQVKEPG